MVSLASQALRSKSSLLLAIVMLAACGKDEVTAPDSTTAPELDRGRGNAASVEKLARLGQRIFNDENLSLNRNQSCASCHAAAWGFTSPDPAINAAGAVLPGSVPSRFAIRKPPSAAYATQSPVLFFDAGDGTYVGGNFWDGRATGRRLGSPAAEQALLPFVGSAEMALPDVACVIFRVTNGPYKRLWEEAFGPSVFSIQFPRHTNEICEHEGRQVPLSNVDRAKVVAEYDRVGLSIAAFEGSPEVNRFSSKYDAYLAGMARLTALERKGLELYEGKANCAACHPNAGQQALFTDFTYDNIGIPANPKNPRLLSDPSFQDLGIGGTFNQFEENGKQKVPTLRNLDLRVNGGDKSYMHNGALKSIEEVVHFYNTRDVLPNCATVSHPRRGRNCWPAPEVLENVNVDELGNLGLTEVEERAVAAYLRTLTDGYFVRPGGR